MLKRFGMEQWLRNWHADGNYKPLYKYKIEDNKTLTSNEDSWRKEIDKL